MNHLPKERRKSFFYEIHNYIKFQPYKLGENFANDLNTFLAVCYHYGLSLWTNNDFYYSSPNWLKILKSPITLVGITNGSESESASQYWLCISKGASSNNPS